MFLFNAFGTFGLEVFTWVVAILIGALAGIIFFDVLKTKENSNDGSNHEE